jgi:hypothetical protein
MLEALLGFISPWNVAGVVVLAAVVLYAAKAIEEDRKIRSLGGYAPQRKVWLPFGLDVAYNGARSTIEHRVLEYFNEGTFFGRDHCAVVDRHRAGKVWKSEQAVHLRSQSW